MEISKTQLELAQDIGVDMDQWLLDQRCIYLEDVESIVGIKTSLCLIQVCTINDPLIIALESLLWSFLEESKLNGTVPHDRSDFTSCLVGKKFFVFGGFRAERSLNDLHSFDTGL